MNEMSWNLLWNHSPTLPPSDARSICSGESLIELLSMPLDGAGDGERDPTIS